MTSRIRSLGLLTFACILISFVPVRGGNSELTSLLEKVILKRVVTQASFKGLTFESTHIRET